MGKVQKKNFSMSKSKPIFLPAKNKLFSCFRMLQQKNNTKEKKLRRSFPKSW
jgi:hypothetical protein